MKLAFNEATCMLNSTLDQDIRLAQAYGYEFIEMRLDMLQAWLKQHSLNELAEFFSTCSVTPFGYNSVEDITFCAAGAWREKRAELGFACKAAGIVGGDCLVVVPTILPGHTWSHADIVRDSVKRLREMADEAGEYGMRLAFEPIGSAGCCVRDIDTAMEIVNIVDLNNVGLVVDAFNLYLNDQWREPSRLRQVPVEKIFAYHIDDADNLPVASLDHCHRLFPGNGVIPLEAITRELVAMGYKGICSLELFNPGYWQMEAHDVFEIGARKTRPYLDLPR